MTAPGPPPPFDPECAAVLAGLPPFPTLAVESLASIRQPPPQFMPPTEEQLAASGAFRVERRIVPGPAGVPDLALTICRPATLPSSRPAIYRVHGGGMIMGNARTALPRYLDWAEELDVVVVAVHYRLAPETPHPGPVEDCLAGYSWLVENADQIGVDPRRIVLAGESAGAGLAAALALLLRDRGGQSPAGELLMAPMLDDRNDSPSVLQMAGVDVWDRARNEFGWTALLGNARGGPDVSPYASPARATDLSGLPPTFLDVGSAETFRSEVVDYASRIWLAGGHAELHVWPGGFHGYDGVAPDAAISRQAGAARLVWLRRLLAD
ncbi:Alpha/beta hydrolase [Modestobacter italicus]|uniref:Alpha/beta hydrolase n=1 Tax=Modestobacter italicus (strain DSM 44449 / CECT 9708 / BC 501) TaxID=2732864 RepID=I4EXP6_MODI5|nr:alpha/beta hydrolase [Modestobacter marinus]CCH88159.1 Alpha/beta hydrolase [Modestobacter marinus]